jgi:hypothetical protein
LSQRVNRLVSSGETSERGGGQERSSSPAALEAREERDATSTKYALATSWICAFFRVAYRSMACFTSESRGTAFPLRRSSQPVKRSCTLYYSRQSIVRHLSIRSNDPKKPFELLQPHRLLHNLSPAHLTFGPPLESHHTHLLLPPPSSLLCLGESVIP